MAVSLDDLEPEFRDLVKATLSDCKAAGVDMVPYFTIRTPLVQAKLWRQSRTTSQIRDKIQQLRDASADFLADCIEEAGPQNGPRVTGAIPGLSWHQWGEAVDCFWKVNGKAEWSPEVSGSKNGYRIYAHLGTQRGLIAGGYWQSLRDWPHLQLRQADSPLEAGLSLTKIDEIMRERFG